MMRSGISYYEGFCDLFNINMENKHIEYTIVKDGETTNVSMYANETEEELLEEKYAEIVNGFAPKKEDIAEGLTRVVSKIELEIKVNGITVNEDVIYEDQWNYLPVRMKKRNGNECQQCNNEHTKGHQVFEIKMIFIVHQHHPHSM